MHRKGAKVFLMSISDLNIYLSWSLSVLITTLHVLLPLYFQRCLTLLLVSAGSL